MFRSPLNFFFLVIIQVFHSKKIVMILEEKHGEILFLNTHRRSRRPFQTLKVVRSRKLDLRQK